MRSSETRKLTHVTLGFTLFLTFFSMFIPFSYATEWSPDMRLTWHDNMDFSPSIAQTQDERIWVVWHSFKLGTAPDLFYKVYNGSSTFPWSPRERLTTDSGDDKTPSITTTANGDLWVVWSSNRDGNFEIYRKVYDGSSWSPDTRLTNDTGKDESPSLVQDTDGDLWVVWSSDRFGDPGEIVCSIYNGTDWSPTIRLTTNGAYDCAPSITQDDDGYFWLVWIRGEDLYYKVFDKNWVLKVDETSLAPISYSDENPSIMKAQDGAIWIAWGSHDLNPPDEDNDIYCKIYNEPLWDQKRITYNGAEDLMPAIMQATDGTIWIAWTSNRISNFDIYYKLDSPPQHAHDVAIFSVTRNPDTTCVDKGVIVSIEVVPQNQGNFTEFDVDVTVYVNTTLLGSETNIHLEPGHLKPINFLWNTSDATSGIYTITAEVDITQNDTDPADNTFITGVIVIRIPGDADINGLVEMADFFRWRENFGKTPYQCPPGVYPDFDNNGLVEMYDFFIWRRNFGAQ